MVELKIHCDKCNTDFVKDPRMWPHFLKLKAQCPNCGNHVLVPYRPGYEVNKLPKKRKTPLKDLKSDEKAVSPIIGVILMVAITVVLAAIVFVLVQNLSGEGAYEPPVVYRDEAITCTADHISGWGYQTTCRTNTGSKRVTCEFKGRDVPPGGLPEGCWP